MAVLPAESGLAVPECYRYLMSSSDSEIIDMYPNSLKVDMNMQVMAYLGIELLPYIDPERLVKAMANADQNG
jgi:5'-3' exonuclease